VAWLLTGDWPQQNQELLPAGRLRGLVYETTVPNAARRIASVGDMEDLLDRLLQEPPATPRRQVHELVEGGAGRDDVIAAVGVALANQDDDGLFIDELARLPRDAIAKLARRDPDAAHDVALAMLRHLDRGPFGARDFRQLHEPLAFAFTILHELVDRRDRTAEDLATEFFRAESSWNQWRQMNVTVSWLVGLDDTRGGLGARALLRSGAEAYYAKAVGKRRIACEAIGRELRQ